MVEFLLILIIRAIDLPLLEAYPFALMNLKKQISNDLNSIIFKERIRGGKQLFKLELDYILQTGTYEYFLLLKLWTINTQITFTEKIWFDFCLILTALYLRWTNIGFIIGSILLPIVFYYFFLLMDYYEVMEEFIKGIKESLKKN